MDESLIGSRVTRNRVTSHTASCITATRARRKGPAGVLSGMVRVVLRSTRSSRPGSSSCVSS
eukprot:1088539-Rhodomonas_salina.4